jgi:uncharacterized repeat protein (TIGR03837 family)
MPRWDIFCRVVDNYGDVGVCWRLARQLAAEHEIELRLWVDDLPSLARLCSAVASDVDEQRVERIEVRRWPAAFPQVEAADVVIETFGCELPDSYLAAMMRRAVAPVWINLEYLSAEAWVEDCHRLPSLRTRCPIDKYFFFPGFTKRTGGLLRERDLITERDAFGAAAETEFWRSVGVPARQENLSGKLRVPLANGTRRVPATTDHLRISMFCYANPALTELLWHWAEGQQPVTVLATPGPASEQIAAWFGEPLVPGTSLRRSSLTVYPLPFLPQPQFDRLLWSCDVNFVRGEDSFVRAQWARRPFVWQIYPQSDDVHWAKLDAFLDRYLTGLANESAVRRFWHAWNGRGEITSAWNDFIAQREAIARHTSDWATSLDQNGNLADNLVSFINESKKKR